uniref:Uncharacterized protein n=1 Tax=Calcidiscus leptoporus TaxID=127549 RepID=A0A7S0JM89_9EUKA
MEMTNRFHAQLTYLLTLSALGGILFFRFVVRSGVLELLCGVLLLALYVLPRLLPFSDGADAIWRSPAGQRVVQAYEALVYNTLWDLNEGLHWALLAVAALLLLRCYCRSRRRQALTRYAPPSAASCPSSPTPPQIVIKDE